MAQTLDEEPVKLAMIGVETGRNERPGLLLGDLPETIITSILRLTTPRDAARLACVNTLFRAASSSDLVWKSMLPPSYADIIAQALGAPPSNCSKRAIYEFLCHRVLLQHSTQEIWLDRATGGICRSMGARGLGVSSSYNERYWDWGHGKQGSRYNEIAYLKLNVWNEAQGRLQCFLSPGTYTLSWRLFYQSKLIGPVKFSIEAAESEPVKTRCYLTPRGPRTWRGWPQEEQKVLVCRWDRDEWMELDVGEFIVKSKSAPVDVRFSMMQLESRPTRSGLWLDGVVIRPSYLIQHEISSKNQVTGYTDDSWIDAPFCRRVKRKR